VKFPRADKAGTTVKHWVESEDIMPTLLGLKQMKSPAAVQGVDLFRGKEQTFAEESHEGNVLSSLRTRQNGSAIKLISANPGNPRGLAERELYRVESDAQEKTNLAASESTLLGQSEQELEAVSTQARTGALKAREVDLAMDKAAQERLKALGYANE
jgi:arylsulfatase A-like enzyme